MSHTKGPWAVEDGEIVADGFVIGAVYGADDFPCHEAADGEEEECHANARLVAAAPCLLAALEAALAHFGWLMDKGALTREEEPVLEQIRAAIRKARGEEGL